MLIAYWLALLSRQLRPKVKPNRRKQTRRTAVRELLEAVSSTPVGPTKAMSASPSRGRPTNNVPRVLLIPCGNVTTCRCVGSKLTRDLGLARPSRLAILKFLLDQVVQKEKSFDLRFPCACEKTVLSQASSWIRRDSNGFRPTGSEQLFLGYIGTRKLIISTCRQID